MKKKEHKENIKDINNDLENDLIANLGSLNKIKRVIKVFGMVNATTDFDKQPYVINGCSELFVEVFGRENGIAVRSAVGVGSLPENVPVEIEAIFELNE